MIDDCARLRNRVQKILDRDGIGGVLSDVFGVNGMRILRGMVDEEPREEIVASRHVADKRDTLEEVLAYNLAPYSRQILGDLLDCHDYASQKIACYDKLIREGRLREATSSLADDPRDRQGIGLRCPDRSRHWRIRFRLAPPGPACAPATTKAPASGAADEAVRATRRCARCWCAHGAARTDNCQFQGYHKALRVRCGYKRAIVATAHKLLRVVYCVLRTGKPYRDPETDYEAMMVKRNAPRWIRMLETYNVAGRQRRVSSRNGRRGGHGGHGRCRQPERCDITVTGSSGAARRQGVTGQPSASQS